MNNLWVNWAVCCGATLSWSSARAQPREAWSTSVFVKIITCFAARSITTLWCDVKLLLHKLGRQQVSPSAPLPSQTFPQVPIWPFRSCCGRAAHSHPWREEKSSDNVLRQREGGGSRPMNTQVCTPAWTPITAAATVERERRTPGSSSNGRSFRLLFIYLSICVCVEYLLYFYRGWTVWREVCTHLRTSEIKNMG